MYLKRAISNLFYNWFILKIIYHHNMKFAAVTMLLLSTVEGQENKNTKCSSTVEETATPIAST